MKPKLSIIIPNYNEKANLDAGVLNEVYDYLKKAAFTWEVIINEDGSTDGGDKIISDFVKKHDGFRMIKGSHAGKAAGIWNGIKEAKGEIVLFTDMDQSTPLKEVEKLLPWYDKGFDVVFGSRGKMRENAPLFRQIASWGWRTFRQALLLRHVIDTQCGFKSARTNVAKEIFPRLGVIKNAGSIVGWTVSAWDVEYLFLCEKSGYKLKEVNVNWRDRDKSTSKNRNSKFVKESVDMMKQITTVKMNDLKGLYEVSSKK